MVTLRGYTKDRLGAVLPEVSVEIKNDVFQTIYQTMSDENGYYEMQVPEGKYPFLIAVRDYASKYLEYWAQELPLTEDMRLDIRIDQVEIYGLHAFRIKGAGKLLTIYFRPMSLARFFAGESDIAPVLSDSDIRVSIDGVDTKICIVNKVSEYADDRLLTGYLLQATLPEGIENPTRVDVSVETDGTFGSATLFL